MNDCQPFLFACFINTNKQPTNRNFLFPALIWSNSI
uniref:Uncharacterized protein n=1 Tax=Rhizophora mucronata TaxID=61149 RepID=A0A2P2MTQ6_RHIMU